MIKVEILFKKSCFCKRFHQIVCSLAAMIILLSIFYREFINLSSCSTFRRLLYHWVYLSIKFSQVFAMNSFWDSFSSLCTMYLRSSKKIIFPRKIFLAFDICFAVSLQYSKSSEMTSKFSPWISSEKLFILTMASSSESLLSSPLPEYSMTLAWLLSASSPSTGFKSKYNRK